MIPHHTPNCFVVLLRHWVEVHHFHVAVADKSQVIENKSHATAHACGKVLAGGTQHDNDTAGHVLAAMVAHAFDNGTCPGIAHSKTLPCPAVNINLSGGSAIERNVADDDIFRWVEGSIPVGSDDEAATGKTFAEVIVGLSFEYKVNALY